VSFSLVLIGITALSLQIIYIKEFFTVFFGNELSIGLLMFLWFLGGSAGAFLGRRACPSGAEGRARHFYIQAIFHFAIALMIPVAFTLIRLSRYMTGMGLGEIAGLSSILFTGGIAFIPVSAMLGFMFVRASMIADEGLDDGSITRAYILESAGGAFGGIATSLVLIQWIGPVSVIWLIAFLNVFVSLSLMKGKVIKMIAAVSIAALMAWSFVFGFVPRFDRLTQKLKWHGTELIASKDSVYGNVAVTEHAGQYTVFTDGLIESSAPDALTQEESVHFAMLMHPDPKKVLLVGGGVGGIINEILKYPVTQITYVEPDPVIIELADAYLNKETWFRLDDRRVRKVHEDARLFIRSTDEKFDVVILNLPGPYNARINRFYTSEFYREVAARIDKRGILSFGATSSDNYISVELAQYLRSIFYTLSCVFPEVAIVPGDTAYFLSSMSQGEISLDPGSIEKRRVERNIQASFIRDYYLRSKLSDERLAYVRKAASYSGSGSASTALENKDFRPISYYFDLVLWSSFFSSSLTSVFRCLTLPVQWAIVIFLSIIACVAGAVLKRSGKKTVFPGLFSLGVTGASAMVFQILIIISYQVLFGHLYYCLGLIIAGFMLGIVIGAYVIMRSLKDDRRMYRLFTNVQIAQALYAVSIAAVFFGMASLRYKCFLSLEAGTTIFFILPVIAGALAGMQYPLANAMYFKDPGFGRVSAGVTYAVDLFGACVGSLVVSALVIPVAGIYQTAFMCALLNSAAVVLLIGGGRDA